MKQILEVDYHGGAHRSLVRSPEADRHVVRLAECKTQSPADRELREQLHRHRYLMFQTGSTVKEIARSEGVDERQIYLSISHVEARLPRSEVIASRNFRNALIIQQKLAEKYVVTLSDLLEGRGGKNWYQRCRALQHFRRTVGLEGSAGIHVNTGVNIRSGAITDGSYEERLARIRARQKAVVGPGVFPMQGGKVLAMLGSGKPEFE